MIILVLMLCYGQSDGQYYSRRYPLTTAGFISSVQIVDDTVYAMCEAVDTDTPHTSIGYFVKFDKAGDIVSQTPFRIPGKTTIGANKNNLIRTRDGGFAYGGWTSGHSQSDNSIFIAKYDKAGNLQWYKDLPDTNYLTYYSLAFIQDSFSNYYFTGFVSEKGSYKDDIYITKVDSNGNLIYMKVIINNDYRDKGGTGICFDNKGNIVINAYGTTCNVNNYTTCETHMIIYKLDTSGIVLSRITSSDISGPVGGPIIPIGNNQYLSTEVFSSYRDTFTWFGKGAIILLDSNFRTVWENDSLGPSSYNTQLFAVSPSPDGNFIAVGSSQNGFDTVHYNNISGWIIKFTATGQILWNKLYRGVENNTIIGDYNLLCVLGFFSDGTILTGAQATDNAPIPFHQQGWLLHLDTAGCLPDSNNCGIMTSVSTIKDDVTLIWLYPNPASDHATLSYTSTGSSPMEILLYDATGRLIRDKNVGDNSGDIDIDLTGVSTGMYVVNLMENAQLVFRSKLVISR